MTISTCALLIATERRCSSADCTKPEHPLPNPFSGQIRIYQWGRKNFSACKGYSGEREQFLGIFGAADEHGEDAGIQKKNFEWVIEQTQNLLLKKYEPKTGKFEGVCCIYDRSEYTAAQQFCRPVFFSENGKPRREALELARVWVSIFKQLGLTPQKQIQIKKSEDSDKLVAVDVQPVAEP